MTGCGLGTRLAIGLGYIRNSSLVIILSPAYPIADMLKCAHQPVDRQQLCSKITGSLYTIVTYAGADGLDTTGTCTRVEHTAMSCAYHTHIIREEWSIRPLH